jgi:hypothetical protein
MTVLNYEEWYEVRYYSPYIGGKVDGLVLNSIKVMPAGSRGGAAVRPVALS